MQTALGWEAYARSGDPIVIGIIGLAEFVPALAVRAARRARGRSPRPALRDGLRPRASSASRRPAWRSTRPRGDAGVWPLYGLALFIGVGPVVRAARPTPRCSQPACPAEELPRVMAMNASVWQFGTIAGPVAAGLLHLLGAPAPFVVAAVGAGLGAVLALAVPAAIGKAHLSDEPHSATLAEALEGVRFILRTPAMLGTMSLDLVAVLLGGATALLPVFSQRRPARRGARQRAAALGARSRCRGRRAAAHRPAAQSPRRAHHVLRGGAPSARSRSCSRSPAATCSRSPLSPAWRRPT